MIALDDGRRARRQPRPAMQSGRGLRWLAAGLVSLVLLSWVATVYIVVLVADGLSETNSHVDWWAHVIAIALIAVTIEPIRRWLRITVDDVVFGHLDGAYTRADRAEPAVRHDRPGRSRPAPTRPWPG